MFTGFTDETVRFLMDLRFHNYAEYFHANHDRYVEEVQQPFYRLIEDLAPAALKIDPEMEIRPHKCLSRIHRDTRFSRDKSPYRDHHWFLFRRSAEPREKSLFFFGEFGPDQLGWGMGIWGENREVLDIFRKKIVANPDGIQTLIHDMDLPERHLGLGGTFHKRMPVPESVPSGLSRWYLSKEMYIGKVDPERRIAFSDRLRKEMESDFLAMAPLYRLLRGIYDEKK